MTARFFLAGVDITRPRIEEDPGGPVRILLNDRDDWITVENRADCALLMQPAADADSAFIRRRAAAAAHAAIEAVMAPDLSGDLLVIPANRISDGSEYGPPGYEGEEPLSVLSHRAPPEAPIGEPTCDEKDGNWACTASPLHAGDHASHGAGNVMHQWQPAPPSEDATT